MKVLDFGLAKAGTIPERRCTADTDDTREGLILGTAAYMSPEQARGKRVDKRTDIWAFGCVLWEMLTGRAAFAGDTVSDTIAAILDREPAWDTLPSDTPATFAGCCNAAWKKIPSAAFAISGMHSSNSTTTRRRRRSLSKPRWREAAAWSAAAGVCSVHSPSPVYSISARPRAGASRVSTCCCRERVPIRDVALSADGRRLAFVGWSADGQRRLWVRPTDSLEARALEGTEGAGSPFWSPDGRFIAFFAQGKLRKIASAGGAPQVLCDAEPKQNYAAGRGARRASSCSHRSRRRAVPGVGQRRKPDAGDDAARGTGSAIASRSSCPTAVTSSSWLKRATSAPSGIYVGSLDSPETVLVLETAVKAQYAPPGYLLFVRGNALMAQSFDPGAMRLSGDVIVDR